MDTSSDPEEQRVLYAALDSFSLSEAHVDHLSAPPFSLPDTFNRVDDAIDSNADISEAILRNGLLAFGVDYEDDSWQGKATPNDIDKARSTIRQLYRDWSAEGRAEREAAYSPIIQALHAYLPAKTPTDRARYQVLIPGAGLGRLVLEICAEGYSVEGNEISFHQLLASHYMLNCIEKPAQQTLYPWALSFSNHRRRANQLMAVSIPDVHPDQELRSRSDRLSLRTPANERMSMSAGDFCSAYRQPGAKEAFDAVTTCFFIDTAPNLINYIETVKHCLRPGGVWINLGPLLWHFESAPTPAEREAQRQTQQEWGQAADDRSESAAHEGIGEPGSFELSNDEVVALVARFGFKIEEQVQTLSPTGYIQDPESMLQNTYYPSFWIARKQ